MELPRITRSMRTFTDLDRTKLQLEPNDLLKKRREIKSRKKRGFTWQDLCRSTPKSNLFHLNKLRKVAVKCLGESSSELVEEFLMFFLRVTIDKRFMTQTTLRSLKEKAACLSDAEAEDMFQTVTVIRECLNEELMETLTSDKENVENGEILREDSLFGCKLEFRAARVLWPDTEKLHDMSEGSLNRNTDGFSMRYQNEEGKAEKSEFDKSTYKNLLRDHHRVCGFAPSHAVFENAILTKLRESTNLENDLYEFLGVHCLNLIRYLIQHKNAIINSLQVHQKTTNSRNYRNSSQGPPISSQVIIQSEKEKQYQKQIRKGEKKLNKHCSSLEPIGMQLMRRDAALESRAPIFNRSSQSQNYVKYPFVFDSNAENKNRPNFVSTQKILLPETAIRRDTETYESLHIPISEDFDYGDDENEDDDDYDDEDEDLRDRNASQGHGDVFQGHREGFQGQNSSQGHRDGFQGQNSSQGHIEGFQGHGEGFQGQNSSQGHREGFQGQNSSQGHREGFQGYKDGFQGQNSSQGHREGFQGHRDGFQGQNSSQGHKEGFQGHKDGFQGHRDEFQGQKSSEGHRDGFQGHRDGFQGQNSSQGHRDAFQGHKDGFQGRNSSQGHMDGFQGHKEEFEGQDGSQGHGDGSQGHYDGFQGQSSCEDHKEGFQGHVGAFEGHEEVFRDENASQGRGLTFQGHGEEFRERNVSQDHREILRGREDAFQGQSFFRSSEEDFQGRDGVFQDHEVDLQGHEASEGRGNVFQGGERDFQGNEASQGRGKAFEGHETSQGRGKAFQGRGKALQGREGDSEGRGKALQGREASQGHEVDVQGHQRAFQGRDADFQGHEASEGHRNLSQGREATSQGQTTFQGHGNVSQGREATSQGQIALQGHREAFQGHGEAFQGQTAFQGHGNVSQGREATSQGQTMFQGHREASQGHGEAFQGQTAFQGHGNVSQGREATSQGQTMFQGQGNVFQGREATSQGQTTFQGHREASQGHREVSQGQTAFQGHANVSQGREATSQGQTTFQGHREAPQGQTAFQGHREASQGHGEAFQGQTTSQGHREVSQGHREASQGQTAFQGHGNVSQGREATSQGQTAFQGHREAFQGHREASQGQTAFQGHANVSQGREATSQGQTAFQGHREAFQGHREASQGQTALQGHREASQGHGEAFQGQTAFQGHREASQGQTAFQGHREASQGHGEASQGQTTSQGHREASQGHREASQGQTAFQGHREASQGHGEAFQGQTTFQGHREASQGRGEAFQGQTAFQGHREASQGQTAFQGHREACQGQTASQSSKKSNSNAFKGFKPCKIPELAHVKPILISDLDEIGKTVFNGTHSLNLIQSVVFNTAYNTNENLLVCAPTGAGKTNVALLTIIHQLKQVLKSSSSPISGTNLDLSNSMNFKIVYVAPMKALASEMTENFSRKLKPIGVNVKELTGDTQLTKSEITRTQMIVTTPEKWDVVTRKGATDISLTNLVKLLIIDEVHLLNGDRGPVVEALVARTLRQIESSQNMIRIIGLSATLPNYVDVARFLRVNPNVGLFYFDHRFRPVPLAQTFVGVKSKSPLQEFNLMNQICYDKTVEVLKKGSQVMVFVHARNLTVKVAKALKELAMQNEQVKLFTGNQVKTTKKPFVRSQNKYLIDLIDFGLSVHHAGLLRAERNLIEKYFSDGLIRVLICTSTLAWGVNLPAHAVIIRGTEIYDSKHGSYVDLGILDVLQIFGRAGRPQFDKSGLAIIITTHNKLHHYLSLLTNQIPIESSFVKFLADNLNAEIVLGTISNVNEAIEWLSYTYLFVRMRINYQVYGLTHKTIQEDKNLEKERRNLIQTAAKALDQAKMIRFNDKTGDLNSTNLGRIASHFYLKYDTIEIFNELLKPVMNDAEIFAMISKSQEFEQLKVRDDEMDELENLMRDCCKMIVEGGAENIYGKVNILIQSFLSRCRLNSFSLISDQAYIITNASRISRALFEIMLAQNNAIMSGRLLEISKMIENQIWSDSHPLTQFNYLSADLTSKLENLTLNPENLVDVSAKELSEMMRVPLKSANLILKSVEELPRLKMAANLQPITRTVLKIILEVRADFKWNDKIHGAAEPFWIWIEDPESNFLYHHEYFKASKKFCLNSAAQELIIIIPLTESSSRRYFIKATSDRWLNCESVEVLNLQDLILPEIYPPHTDLLKLQPLSIKSFQSQDYENLYNFSHFNPIQTQIFHCLYHSNANVLLGAPTGSGKTIAAEMAILRVFKTSPDKKAVYIAPLKALVRERMKDWRRRLGDKLGKKIVELTGDVTPDVKSIKEANLIVTTPEKWDGISRSWQTRKYVKDVELLVIDEIHLLGEVRGPVLEVIVSRTNFISSSTGRRIRIVGLSTALANAVDLASWLGIGEMGLYNFRPAVRPVPLEIHINGFPGKNYCPRMATMNRPTFQAIRQHAPTSPSLVFVSSRRQTRLTALDLMAYLAAEDNPKQWLRMDEEEMNSILDHVRDTNLKLTLAFGIGLHHAGLQDNDRKMVEELFVNNKIQVLITTATLAWGVNFPAHLVVIKGTEYFDAKHHRYVDMPITDILQMMGRAGRPQFDNSGVAVVLVHDVKKDFYKKFLHEPFPVESSLLSVLPDHVNAEIVAGTIKNKQEFMDYLTWTYLFVRLMKNPMYYDLTVLEEGTINRYLSQLVDRTVRVLVEAFCVDYDEEEQILYPLPMGKIASFYYLSHKTMMMFHGSMSESLTLEECLSVLCHSTEYDELPVRHDEEFLNEELSKSCRFQVKDLSFASPHTKASLLLQAHFSRLPLPCVDYVTDTKSVLDQAIRILQAMIDTAAENGFLTSAITMINLLQMTIQARWIDEPAISTLPRVSPEFLPLFARISTILPEFCYAVRNKFDVLAEALGRDLGQEEIYQIHEVAKEMPIISVDLSVQQSSSDFVEDVDKRSKSNRIQLTRDSNAIEIRRDEECILNVTLRRKNKSETLRAHCPFFHKGKDEGWFLVLGNTVENELTALKRVNGVNEQRKSCQLQFAAPSNTGPTILTIFLMSDCYMGLDQQYDIKVNVID